MMSTHTLILRPNDLQHTIRSNCKYWYMGTCHQHAPVNIVIYFTVRFGGHKSINDIAQIKQNNPCYMNTYTCMCILYIIMYTIVLHNRVYTGALHQLCLLVFRELSIAKLLL